MAAEADACAKELTQILKQRMVTQKDEAAECIQMVRKLGEPIESLQVQFQHYSLCSEHAHALQDNVKSLQVQI